MAAGPEVPSQSLNVRLPILVRRLEMEDGPVVPEVHRSRQVQVTDIASDPLNQRRAIAEACTGAVEGGGGNVGEREIREPALQ